MGGGNESNGDEIARVVKCGSRNCLFVCLNLELGGDQDVG